MLFLRPQRRARWRDPCRWVLVLLQPLYPLLICCLLGAAVVVVAEPPRTPPEGRLDQNGTLVNASTSAPQRSFLLYQWPPPPAFAPSTCQLLTNVSQLCDEFESRAARRLQFCDMFDYRQLLVFAGSLTNDDCSSLLLSGTPNKTMCVRCLSALVDKDLEARQGMADHARVLDKVQCNSWRIVPSAASSISTTSLPYGVSPSSSSLSSTESSEILTEVPMTPQTHAGSSNCADCKEVYKGWLCTAIFDHVTPFAAREELSWDQRRQKVPACDNWCAAVETQCPYFTPDEEQQNGGEPLFLCREAHYHDSPRYPLPTSACRSGTHRHLCCYTVDDLTCQGSNASCASLEEVCLASPNVSDSSALSNWTAVTSSAGRTGDCLLLLLMVAYCCSWLT